LGKNNEGMRLPLMVDIKMDRKGLTAEEESGRKGQPGIVTATPIRFDFSGKHPVSALNEICTKRKWNMPNFILMDEAGPSHSKTFRFKVEVNNVEYVPLTSSSTKKMAKLEAATVCLQQLGLLLRS